ncbi:MAG: DUF6503 family protein [Christiangramia sp.]|uniref:DUF6503 family protein n=1 Tax=Christiangramia sp. TaxID=1931228 RepID=UPI003242CBE2
MMKYLFYLITALFAVSCAHTEEKPTADDIVNEAIEASGGESYNDATISFRFRDMEYKSVRKGGTYLYERFQKDSADNLITDELSNEGFERKINDSLVQLPDSLKQKYSNSVNSVHYFVQLPYGLNAEAANKELIGKDTIDGKEYYEIKVTFDAEGGGTDHEDEYVYWIDTQHYEVDYLAYNYEVNGGGVRFRKAYNPRTVGGIRFVDYENYKYDDLAVKLSKLDSLFTAGKLQKVSTIQTEAIEVTHD